MYRMPARFAPNACRAKRASSGPWDRSVGHTRKKYGLIPLRSGLEADGEITGTGLAPPPYTRAAAMVVPDVRCPTTATRSGSRYSSSATRTAVSSRPESSATRSLRGRPFTPPLALISAAASSAACRIATPRGWENGPATPMMIGPVSWEQAASHSAAPSRTGLFPRGPPGTAGHGGGRSGGGARARFGAGGPSPACRAGARSCLPRPASRHVPRPRARALAARGGGGPRGSALGRRRAADHRRRYAGTPGTSLLRLPRSRRTPSARGVAAVRALPHDAGRASCVRRGSGGGGALLPGSGGPAGRAVRADSRGRNAAALPRAQDPRVPLRAVRPAQPAAVRAAARHWAHRPRPRAL